MSKSNTVALKGAGSMNYAYFTPDGRGNVEVVALLGLVYYIDRTMPAAEAHAEAKKLLDKGWQRVDSAQALKNMPIQTLRYYIYD